MTSLISLWLTLQQSLNREEGQDMIEYSLLAALISVVAIAGILLVGPFVQGLYSSIVGALASM